MTGAHFYISVTGGDQGGTSRPTGPSPNIHSDEALTCLPAIMAQNRPSPWESLRKLHSNDAKKYGLPDMQKSLDIMWSMWKLEKPDDEWRKIRYFIILITENETTLSPIERALDKNGVDLTKEGITFTGDSEEGRALIGNLSPISAHASIPSPYVRGRSCSITQWLWLRTLPHQAQMGAWPQSHNICLRVSVQQPRKVGLHSMWR